MLTRTEWCRQKANECIALALSFSDHEGRAQLHNLAQQWLRLADLADWLDDRSPGRMPSDGQTLH
jgi:hypothetical protein